MDRRPLAFLVAGFVAPVFVTAWFTSGEGAPKFSDYVLIFGVSTFFSFGGILFLGVPAYSFLRTRNWTAFWIAPVMGFSVATVIWHVSFFFLGLALTGGQFLRVLSDLIDHSDYLLWPAGPIGAFVGILVWLIARPDRSTTVGNAANADKLSKP